MRHLLSGGPAGERAGPGTTPDHVRRLAQAREDLVRHEAGVAVGRQVVLSLQGRRLPRRPHEVYRPVLRDEVRAGPGRIEAGGPRLNVEHDEINVVLGALARANGHFTMLFVFFH